MGLIVKPITQIKRDARPRNAVLPLRYGLFSLWLTRLPGSLSWQCMATKTFHVTLPGELSGFVERTIQGGRYQDASEVVREALRRMEAAELANELRQFERAFAGGHNRSETEQDIERVEAAVRAVRKR